MLFITLGLIFHLANSSLLVLTHNRRSEEYLCFPDNCFSIYCSSHGILRHVTLVHLSTYYWSHALISVPTPVGCVQHHLACSTTSVLHCPALCASRHHCLQHWYSLWTLWWGKPTTPKRMEKVNDSVCTTVVVYSLLSLKGGLNCTWANVCDVYKLWRSALAYRLCGVGMSDHNVTARCVVHVAHSYVWLWKPT